MKNAFSLKLSWCVIFLLLSVLLFGQQHSLNFQVKKGITNFKNQKRDYSSYENFNIPGGDISIGLIYRFSFFKEKYFTGGLGVLWYYSSFAKRRISLTNDWINAPAFFPYGGYERTHRFQSHSIIFPVTVRTQVWKIGFSFGLIPRYHLSNKMFFEQITEIKNTPLEYDLLTTFYVAGETITDDLGNIARVFLKDDMDIQFIFGFDIYLTERLSFELEYKDLMNDNFLQIRSNRPSGYYNVFPENHEFSLATISVGLSWRIF